MGMVIGEGRAWRGDEKDEDWHGGGTPPPKETKVTKPIKPDEVGDAKTRSIPPEVFEAFNELITGRWDGRRSYFTQAELMLVLMLKFDQSTPVNKVTREHVFKNHWLDVEDSYRAEGWIVEYDRPGYCETYEANFTFSKR